MGMTTSWLAATLISAAAQPWLLIPVIMIASFVLEDVAVIAVAVLVSRMLIPGDFALITLVIGTFLGDVALYAAARWARNWRYVRKWLEKPALQKTLALVRRSSVVAVIAARFIPGTRLPVFVAAGAAGMPPLLFVSLTFVTTIIWTPSLYYAATGLDMHAAATLGNFGWVVAAVMIVLAIGVSQLSARLAMRRRAA